MARMSAEQLDEFLTRPIVGVLATSRRNGQPYAVPVSWAWIDGAFWISGTAHRMWCRHLAERPVATLCVQTYGPEMAYISVDCDAAIHTEDDFPDLWERTKQILEPFSRQRPNATPTDQYIEQVRHTETRLLVELTPQAGENSFRALDLDQYTSGRHDTREARPGERT